MHTWLSQRRADALRGVAYRGATLPIHPSVYDKIKLLQCRRAIIGFSSISSFVDTCQRDPDTLQHFHGELGKIKSGLKIDNAEKFHVTHILSATLFHGTNSVVEQAIWLHRTDPNTRKGVISYIAYETLCILYLFGPNVVVTPMHFVFRHNDLDHNLNYADLNREYRYQLEL